MPSEQLACVDRRSVNGLRRRHADFDQRAKLACIPTVRQDGRVGAKDDAHATRECHLRVCERDIAPALESLHSRRLRVGDSEVEARERRHEYDTASSQFGGRSVVDQTPVIDRVDAGVRRGEDRPRILRVRGDFASSAMSFIDNRAAIIGSSSSSASASTRRGGQICSIERSWKPSTPPGSVSAN